MQLDPTPDTPFTVDDARVLFEHAAADVQEGARFVVRNKVRILAIPVTIVTVAAGVGLDVSHVVPSWLATVLGIVVAAASLVTGATRIAGKYATTADPQLVPRELDGGVLLNASEAVALAKSGQGRAQADDPVDPVDPVPTTELVDDAGNVADVPTGGVLLGDDDTFDAPPEHGDDEPGAHAAPETS